MIDVNDNLQRVLIGTFIVLMISTIVRIVALRNADPDLRSKRIGSLKVWWVLSTLLLTAAIFGRVGASVLLAVAGALGLREIIKMIGSKEVGTSATVVAFSTIVLQYSLIIGNQSEAAKSILPISALLVFSIVRLVRGDPNRFLLMTAGIYWAVMLLVYSLSHAALLFMLPIAETPLVGASGWFLFVVIVTETDDIAQALIGRIIGRRRITPTISPNKTWEGFLGGVITSVILSLLLAPWLTTFPSASTMRGLLLAVAAGLLIVTAAFLGDINMSAIKRDAGVKDGSAILPGMGGIIDRVDSLIFTAPAFYYFLLVVL